MFDPDPHVVVDLYFVVKSSFLLEVVFYWIFIENVTKTTKIDTPKMLTPPVEPSRFQLKFRSIVLQLHCGRWKPVVDTYLQM